MTTITRHPAGTFCWTQLGTSDPEGAKKFYSALFGWGKEETSVGTGPSFTLLKKEGKPIGMLYALLKPEKDQGLGPNWMSLVAVENVDDIAANVKKSGGKVLQEPFDVAENGRMGVFQDPTGAVFSVWHGKKQTGAAVINETGAMCWNELITNDTAKAGAFYKQVFGWTEEPMKTPTSMGGTYTIFKKDGTSTGGMIKATPQMKLTHPYWLVYFEVDDCDRTVAKAQQLGGKTMLPPTDIPDVGRFSVLTDPQGAYFAIIKPAPQM